MRPAMIPALYPNVWKKGLTIRDVNVDQLSIGMEVELTLGTLYTDEDHEYLVWKWKPAAP
jgi:uncharacterized protein